MSDDEYITICSSCKNVQLNDAAWETIEAFILERFGVIFSHGVCPSCMKRLYGEEKFKRV